MRKNKENDLVVHVYDAKKFYEVSDWCTDNLKETDYEFVLISIFPLYYKVRFSCPTAHVLILLGT